MGNKPSSGKSDKPKSLGDSLAASGGEPPALSLRPEGSKLPVLFKWTHGGQQVSLVGDFTNWQPMPMVRSGIEFSVALDLPFGVYQYRFVVDNEQRYAQDQPVVHGTGGVHNVLDIVNYQKFEPLIELANRDAETAGSMPYGHSLQATGPPGMSGDGQYSGPPTVPLVLYKSPHLAAPLSSGFGPLSVREVEPTGPARSPLGGNPSPPLFTNQVLVGHVYHDGGSSFSSFGVEALAVATTLRHDHKFSTLIYIVPDTLTPASRPYGARDEEGEGPVNLLKQALDGGRAQEAAAGSAGALNFAPPPRKTSKDADDV